MSRSLKEVFELTLSPMQLMNKMEYSCVSVLMVVFKRMNVRGIYNNFNNDI